jgi:hypothetical protein
MQSLTAYFSLQEKNMSNGGIALPVFFLWGWFGHKPLQKSQDFIYISMNSGGGGGNELSIS